MTQREKLLIRYWRAYQARQITRGELFEQMEAARYVPTAEAIKLPVVAA